MTEITNDTFFIADRLREIDSAYRVFYHDEEGRFEVHSEENGRRTLECVLPYRELDARSVLHVLRTRVCHFDTLRAEEDKINEKLGGSYFALR